jgi:hypothetical protein
MRVPTNRVAVGRTYDVLRGQERLPTQLHYRTQLVPSTMWWRCLILFDCTHENRHSCCLSCNVTFLLCFLTRHRFPYLIRSQFFWVLALVVVVWGVVLKHSLSSSSITLEQRRGGPKLPRGIDSAMHTRPGGFAYLIPNTMCHPKHAFIWKRISILPAFGRI